MACCSARERDDPRLQFGYPRVIQFHPGVEFVVQDLVSPCPQDVICIWSGIVYTTGTYAVSRDASTFKAVQPENTPAIAPFPDVLTIDPASSALVETTPEGDRCRDGREKGTTVPQSS